MKKECTKCHREKNANEKNFPPRPKNPDSLDSWCRTCCRKADAERKKRKESIYDNMFFNFK